LLFLYPFSELAIHLY